MVGERKLRNSLKLNVKILLHKNLGSKNQAKL